MNTVRIWWRLTNTAASRPPGLQAAPLAAGQIAGVGQEERGYIRS